VELQDSHGSWRCWGCGVYDFVLVGSRGIRACVTFVVVIRRISFVVVREGSVVGDEIDDGDVESCP